MRGSNVFESCRQTLDGLCKSIYGQISSPCWVANQWFNAQWTVWSGCLKNKLKGLKMKKWFGATNTKTSSFFVTAWIIPFREVQLCVSFYFFSRFISSSNLKMQLWLQQQTQKKKKLMMGLYCVLTPLWCLAGTCLTLTQLLLIACEGKNG